MDELSSLRERVDRLEIRLARTEGLTKIADLVLGVAVIVFFISMIGNWGSSARFFLRQLGLQ